MDLSHYELIQIDATIIIGLFFLLTFQTFTSTVTEDEIKAYMEKLYNADIKRDKIIDQLLKCDESKNNQPFLEPELLLKFQDRCNELKIEQLESESERAVLERWGFQYGYLDENLHRTIYVKNLLSAPLSMNLINLIMILPFAISAIIESIFAIRKKDENKASKAGLIIMLFGFFVIIIGLSIIAYIFFHATGPFASRIDEDNDYLFDNAEPDIGTDPSNPDTDGDGLVDGVEFLNYYTDPLNRDTDGDGIDDGVEIDNGTDPLR